MTFLNCQITFRNQWYWGTLKIKFPDGAEKCVKRRDFSPISEFKKISVKYGHNQV